MDTKKYDLEFAYKEPRLAIMLQQMKIGDNLFPEGRFPYEIVDMEYDRYSATAIVRNSKDQLVAYTNNDIELKRLQEEVKENWQRREAQTKQEVEVSEQQVSQDALNVAQMCKETQTYPLVISGPINNLDYKTAMGVHVRIDPELAETLVQINQMRTDSNRTTSDQEFFQAARSLLEEKGQLDNPAIKNGWIKTGDLFQEPHFVMYANCHDVILDADLENHRFELDNPEVFAHVDGELLIKCDNMLITTNEEIMRAMEQIRDDRDIATQDFDDGRTQAD